jgi:hypothetical protein
MAKKGYSVQWEEGEAVAFEINGVRYTSLDEVPSPRDRRKLMAIMSAANAAELEEDTPVDSWPIEKIILNIFTGIAALMLVIAAFSAFSAIRTIAREASAPGRVVDMVIQREYINEQDRIVQEYYYPVVQFTARDGRRREVRMSVGSDAPEYEKGDEVTVLYDPAHPLDARIKSFGSAAMMWILPSITGILGICFLGAVVLVRRVISQQPAVVE